MTTATHVLPYVSDIVPLGESASLPFTKFDIVSDNKSRNPQHIRTEEDVMLIAVASDGLDVASAPSHCTNYNYYRVVDGEIVDSQNLPSEGALTGRPAHIFRDLNVETIITSTISDVARQRFEDVGVEVVTGASGRALLAAQAYLDRVRCDTTPSC